MSHSMSWLQSKRTVKNEIKFINENSAEAGYQVWPSLQLPICSICARSYWNSMSKQHKKLENSQIGTYRVFELIIEHELTSKFWRNSSHCVRYRRSSLNDRSINSIVSGFRHILKFEDIFFSTDWVVCKALISYHILSHGVILFFYSTWIFSIIHYSFMFYDNNINIRNVWCQKFSINRQTHVMNHEQRCMNMENLHHTHSKIRIRQSFRFTC